MDTINGMTSGTARRGSRPITTVHLVVVVCLWTAMSVSLPASLALPGPPAPHVTFEQTVTDLSSADPATRLRAVKLLKSTSYPEAALPIAPLILDAFDETQFEAIAAELNIFLVDKVTPRRRVGLLVEVRNQIAAEQIFATGPSAIGPARVPAPVLSALATASKDPNARVAVEAIYAFGALAGDAALADRRSVLAQAGPVLAATIGATDPVLRLAALRVIGRVFAKRPDDAPVDESVGDAVIMALNDRESLIQQTAMWALGRMKYARAVQGLNELFQYHQRGALAEGAFQALAHIGHPSSLPQFVAQLNGRNQTYKLIAIEGLARTGDLSRADSIMNVLATEKNEALLLAGHFANVKLSNGPVEAIVDALSRGKLYDQARDYLFEITPGRASAFARHLQDGDVRVRVELIDALGLSSDPAAVPLLEPLVKDKDASVARAAVRALARLRPTQPA